MRTQTFRTIIQKDGRFYHGYVPSLPGCHTQGKTIEETQKNLKKAIKLWITTHQELKWPVPEDSSIESLLTITIKPSSPSTAYA